MNWSCSCGNLNAGIFCVRCGAMKQGIQKPEAALQSQYERVAGRIILGVLGVAALIFVLSRAPERDTERPLIAEGPTPGNVKAADESAAPDKLRERPSEASGKGDPPSFRKPPIHVLGEKFSIGYWSYICNEAAWTPVLGYGFGAERPDAAFLVIDITVENRDTSASTLPAFSLVDSEGRSYEETSKTALMDGFFGVLEKLNPDVSKRSRIAFDVPPDRDYELVVPGGFESAKRARVSLSGQANEQPPPAATPPTQTPPAATPPTAAKAPPAEPPEMRRYRDLATRATSVRAGLKPYEDQYARQGYLIRTDISEARATMNSQMQNALSLIQRGDSEGAHRSLESAQRAIEALETFLHK